MRRKRYRWDTGLRFRVLGLLVFLLSLVVGLGATLSFTFVRLEALQQRADLTRANVVHMEQVQGAFAEMTSALRGYLLAGQDVFLQPYASAQTRLDYSMAQLKASAGTDPGQNARLYQISELVTRWRENVADPEIAAKRAGRPDAGKIVIESGGLNYIEEIRKAATAFATVESDRLEREVTSTRQASSNMQTATWVGAGLAAAFALVGFVIFARSVTRSTDALVKAAELIARGERGVMVEDTLDGELQIVAEAFSSMSVTLAAQEEELKAQQEELVAQNEELLAQQDELQSRAQVLERQEANLSRLNRMGTAMIGTIEMAELGDLIVDEYIDLFDGTAGALLLAAEYSDRMTVQTERWLNPGWRGRTVPVSGPLARCFNRSELTVARYPDTVCRISTWQTEVPVVQEIYIPLVHTGRVLAVVIVAGMTAVSPQPEAEALWGGLARQASTALAAAMKHLEVSYAFQTLQEQAAQVEELNAQLESERDRAAAQLDIYLSIVSTMKAGAWLTDTGGNLLVVNSTFRDFFGEVPLDGDMDSVLDTITKLLPEGDTFPATVRSLVQSRDQTGEGSIRLRSGYVLQWSSAPVGREHDLVGRLFTFQDVTELAELDRMKSEFVNTVSHELRTPLTSIMGYLSLIMHEQAGPVQPQQKEFLEVVLRNTSRLSNLINDVLDIQRIESGRSPLQRKPVSLPRIVQQAADTFRMAAEQKGLAFKVTLPKDDLMSVSGDPERLMQIVSNLLSNAVKYTPQGSVNVAVTGAAGSVVLTVEDTGVGIPASEQQRVFEKFYRGENKYARKAGGTGLGLSIVKELVEEHGGKLKLESDPDKGTRFTVTFPTIA